jgi:hypothetical protein
MLGFVERKRTERVFLVRMWQQGGERVLWRGSVHEIGSGARFYVAGARDVADFINDRLADATPREGEDR